MPGASLPDALFLSHRIPYPPDKGDKIRAWHMLEHISRTHRVHLGCFVDDPDDMQHEAHLRSVCATVRCVPIDRRVQKLRALAHVRPGRPLTLDFYRSADLAQWVRDTLAAQPVALGFAYCSAMAPYLMGHALPRRILDMVDVDSEKWSEYARRTSWPASLVWAREGRTLLRFETEAAQAFDRTLLVSEAETTRFAALAPQVAGRLDWVENGVDLRRFSPGHGFPTPFGDAGPHLVFTGTMDYWPNVDAVSWFARDVLPLLRQSHPGTQFSIVGASPAPEVLALAALPGVAVTGRVADVRPYMAHAHAIVAPLRIARGIQNKVLEGLAMARPVVASPEAHEGIHAEAGRDLLVAGGAQAWASAVGAVLAGHHPGLGAAGRAAVERAYAWQATLRRLDGIITAAPNETVLR